MTNEKMPNSQEAELDPTEYVAPAIETVVTPEKLGREVHYAGFASGGPP
jgi:hypothetical protein